MQTVSSADTAWMLVATALVLLMTPALGFFYAGMVRSKHALNTLMMSFAALGFVGVAWALLGYSVAFGTGSGGVLQFAFLRGVGLSAQGTIPHILFMAYQGTFAIITAALISGAIVERMRFIPYLLFITTWSLIVYAPIAHWVWGPGGWLAQLGALDFAGGTVVHINAAGAAFVVAIELGPRRDYGRQAFVPQNVPFTLLGAGLLWLGWFGFNAGSAFSASPIGALAFANTMFAPAATLTIWTLLDLRRTGKVTAIGTATAIVVGLVAITPAAGLVNPLSALVIGAVAAAPSYYALLWRAHTRLDDSLDVLSAHGVGGVVGALLTGVLSQKSWNGVADGLVFGHPAQLGLQIIAVVVTLVYSMVTTFVLVRVLGRLTPLRAAARDEGAGLDFSQHGEDAYSRGEGAVLILPEGVISDEARRRDRKTREIK